jgi:acyl carrier protein
VTTSVPVPATKELVEEIRLLCARTVEIPIDRVTVDADLAADLGVDSLTQDELVVAVLERYGLAAKANSVQPASYPTVGALADLIQRLSGEEDGADEDAGKSSVPRD